eukprot:TRINITY_DN5553_c0_g1_i2.p1 TRINITY_DN5553_c0_g1~~TRINITY_DN5553_c0_g1_i2.p1  ORF type:complete len:279 (-),score=60.51 TRINITY_DN5553_c0_g1_i2:444-1280(-)
MLRSLVGSEMCIRDRASVTQGACETDYATSWFIGEFHSAFSNLLFFWVGVSSMDLYRRHRLPRRMAILAGCVILLSVTGIGMHVSLHYVWELLRDLAQAGLLITLYRCRGPIHFAEGYRSMASRSLLHFVVVACFVAAQVEWFRELHIGVMTCLILNLNFSSVMERPKLKQRMLRATMLTLGAWLCYTLDAPTCWLMESVLVNPQLLALANLLGSIATHEAVVVSAVLVAEDMGGEAELGVIGYGPKYQLSSVVGWAGISYVEDIEYGIKPVTFTKNE